MSGCVPDIWRRQSPDCDSFRASDDGLDEGAAPGIRSEDDVEQFRKIALPLWFDWLNRDADSARLFKLHLEVMLNPGVAYISPDDINDFELNL